MRTPSRCLLAPLALVAALACGGDSTGPGTGPDLDCGNVTPTSLTPGQHKILDPTATSACVAVPAVPAAGSGGAEYLYVAVATAGQETSSGVSAPYALEGESADAATADVAALPSPLLSAFRPPMNALRFHASLRAQERLLAQDPRVQMFNANRGRALAVAAVAPPDSGSSRTFKVCKDDSCNDTETVTATVQKVRDKIAIYIDNAATASQRYSDAQLTSLATLFDDYLYPIDTTNFGRESDVDNNGVVYVLLTPQVNKLSPNCNETKTLILGYFFGVDLINDPRSNHAEVFYSLVPDPDNNACTVPVDMALEFLAPTFIHEFQHMISFNQHALVRSGPAERTWINEGLSHHAEEIGGRLIPDAANPARGGAPDTYTQFAFSNFQNAYEYLKNPELHYLVEPGESNGTLAERGANWLFIRWLADHFGTSSPDAERFVVRGTDFTRRLVQTNQVGANNVTAATGQQLSTLIPLWQMANYLDDLPNFTPADPRLQYPGLNLRFTFEELHQQDPDFFELPYPLAPDSTKTGAYTRSGTLRAGSGRHVRIIQSPGAAAVRFRLTGSHGVAVSTTVAPRVGVVRIR